MNYMYLNVCCLHSVSLRSTTIIFILLVCTDERFPEYGKVEFVFSYGPEKIKGNAIVLIAG